jgi:uncharacterized protein (TIGR02246 family)
VSRIDPLSERTEVEAAVRTLLDEQSAAWNRGDLDAFCEIYADDALFLSPAGTHRGKDAVRQRYASTYPTLAAMGTLSLQILEIRPAWGPEVSMPGDGVPSRIHAVSIAGRWTLDRSTGPATGLTLLVLHRDGRQWKIVQDASF